MEASQVTQTVKNLHAMWETGVRSLDQEDLLEKRMVIHSYSCLDNSMDRGTWWGQKESDTTE